MTHEAWQNVAILLEGIAIIFLAFLAYMKRR